MRLYFTMVWMLWSIIYSSAQDVDKNAISESIPIENLEHPYLFFTDSDKPAIRQRIQTDTESKQIMDRLLAEANMLLYQPVDSSIPARGTHVRAGWTEEDRENAYERKISKYRGYAETLAFVYQMTDDPKYAQKAFAFAEVVCRMPVWSYQAHEFSIIYSRVMPWNVPDNQVNFNFDIGSATTGQIIAWVYDWTYPALEQWQRDRIKGALLEKVITPVRGDYEFHWWSTSYRCNWTGVCNGGLGIAALALLKDYPQLADVVAESYNRIDKMMNELGEDGGWQEGGSYWSYGMDRSLLFAFALKKASKGQFNLFQNKKLAANPVAFPIYLFVPPNRAVNFGDAHDRAVGGTDFFNLLTTETQSPEGAWYRQEKLGAGSDIFDLIFPRPTLKPRAPTTPSRHFRGIDWWVMRSDFADANKVTVAGKAGKNDDPHHGHLDIGHFILYWQGQAFLEDSGRPYYDEEYFDEERWNYPQAASAGHNVVLVNGEQQIPGKLSGKPFNYDIGGEVLEFRTAAQRDYVVMDPTNAYPKKELQRWRRHVLLEKPNITLVLDEVTSVQQNAEVELRFHSEVKTDFQEKFVLLQGDQGMMALIPIATEAFELRSGKHAYQPIHATRSFEWLPYFGVVLHPMSKQTQVASLMVPVANEAEAKAISQSVKLITKQDETQVSFKYRKQNYSYNYVNGADGLRLR